MEERFDMVVVGAGPAGEKAAARRPISARALPSWKMPRYWAERWLPVP